MLGHTRLETTDQKVGWCIQEYFIDNGIMCIVGSTADDGANLAESYQWWFPTDDDSAPKSVDFADGFDPTSALYDAYRSDGDYYGGLTHFYVDLGINDFTSAKFQLANTDSDSQWAAIDDFRFQLQDYVNLYGMYEDPQGNIYWEMDEQVKLAATTLAATAFAAATALLAF